MASTSPDDVVIAEFEKLFREHGYWLTLHPSGEEGEPGWVATIVASPGTPEVAVAGFGSTKLAAAESAWHSFVETHLKR